MNTRHRFDDNRFVASVVLTYKATKAKDCQWMFSLFTITLPLKTSVCDVPCHLSFSIKALKRDVSVNERNMCPGMLYLQLYYAFKLTHRFISVCRHGSKCISSVKISFVYAKLNCLQCVYPLQWRHNERHGFSNHHQHDCLLNRWFIRRPKKTPKLRVTGLCEGNSRHKSPVTRKMFPFDDVIMLSKCLHISRDLVGHFDK